MMATLKKNSNDYNLSTKDYEESVTLKETWNKGFTLLEVLVSLAIISITFVVIIGSHSRNLEMESMATDITVATIIAREQLERVQIGEIKITFDKTEQIDKKYPGFFWDIRSFETIIPGVNEVALTVYKKQSERKKDLITLSTYLLN
jgi:type II secretion system protein I